MKPTDILKARLCNQRIAGSSTRSVQELANWMGAFQAQDYQMMKWAMGVRLPGSTVETIEQAIADGTVIRTHLMRPTWHVVAADNLRWILTLTAPRIRTAIRSRHKQLGLTKEFISSSNAVISDALAGSDYLTRKELVAILEKNGFKNRDNLISHLLLRAELDGIICSGPSQGKNYTYSRLDGRIPREEFIPETQALERLAKTYFRSHGPATLEDFTWWSGLTKTGARKGLEAIKGDVISEEFDSQIYWMSDEQASESQVLDNAAHLLPAYDEFLISYRNRSMLIPDEESQQKAISNNGIFRPVIVVNGRVAGTWKRSVKKERVLVETEFFKAPATGIRDKVEEAAEYFARFLDRKLEITHHRR